MSGRLLSYG